MTEIEKEPQSFCVAQNAATRSENTAKLHSTHRRQLVTRQKRFSQVSFIYEHYA